MPRNPKVDFDILKVYFRDPYHINLDGVPGEIVIYQPTIGDIVEIGENKIFENLNVFITNTTQYRVFLWDMGIDWNVFSDFQLFSMLYTKVDPEIQHMLFGDLDLRKFKPYLRKKDGSPPDENASFVELPEDTEIILWNDQDEIAINYDVWNHMNQYLRMVFNIFPEEKITNSPFLKQWYIEKDKRQVESRQKDEDSGKQQSILQPIISACVNHPGFKYKLQELREVGIFQFYDSVSRLQIYEQSTALMKGMYSGFVDGSKLKPEDYNFMREIIRDTNNSVHKKLKDNG